MLQCLKPDTRVLCFHYDLPLQPSQIGQDTVDLDALSFSQVAPAICLSFGAFCLRSYSHTTAGYSGWREPKATRVALEQHTAVIALSNAQAVSPIYMSGAQGRPAIAARPNFTQCIENFLQLIALERQVHPKALLVCM